MAKRTIKRYSQAFRRQVVGEYEAGSRITDLKKKYGIGTETTVKKWILKYAQNSLRHQIVRIQRPEEAEQVRLLEARVAELERALGQMTLEKLALESTLEVLSEEYALDVKKNAVSSSRPSGKKRKALEGAG
jgi:transposase-like protein